MKNISTTSEAFDKNGTHLDNVARFFGFSPFNIIVRQFNNYIKDKTYENQITYSLNSTADFKLGRLACTVYNESDNIMLILSGN